MRRAAITLAAAALVVAPLAPASAQAPSVLEATARASVSFAQLDVQPAFDPAWADSRSTSSTIGATSLQSSIWPSFLADAFFFLYGFQSVERLALGIAEARYPQGPTEVDATQSNLLFLNAGDPDMSPGRFGRAYALAGDRDASGDVATGTLVLPGIGAIGGSVSDSRATTLDAARAASRQHATDIAIGPLRVEAVRGRATANAASVPAAEASLRIVGATVGGTEVAIDDEGARASSAPAQAAVDEALAGSGLTVRTLPEETTASADGASADSGGLLVLLERAFDDPAGGSRDVTIGLLFGAARATVRTAEADAGDGDIGGPDGDGPARTITEFIDLPGTPGTPGTTGGEAPSILRRTVVTSAVTFPIGARGAYGAVVLVALGLLLIRPLVRAAARA